MTKIELEIPDNPIVGMIVTGVVTAVGASPVQPPTQPPVQPPTQPPTQPPAGMVPAPWDPNVMLPVVMLGALQPWSDKHAFNPNSGEVQVVQLTGNFTNGGYSSPPPVGNGCWVGLGSTPGAVNATGWISGSDNANISLVPAGGNGMFMAMVLDPSHPPPGYNQSFYSAN